jgi:hypothetical protein
VLRLAGGVARDEDDVAKRLAADPGGVVLDEAVLAARAGEDELLVVIERPDVGTIERTASAPCATPLIAEPSSVTSSARLSSQTGW